jgi:hypothetical protein
MLAFMPGTRRGSSALPYPQERTDVINKSLTFKRGCGQMLVRKGFSMAKRIEVTVTVDDRKMTLEGPEDFVRAEVERFAALTPTKGTTSATSVGGVPAAVPTWSDELSERDLVTQKKPRGHSETVAVLAYVLAKSGQGEFTPDDIRRAYIRAGVRPPKVVSQALRDAKNLNDYIERGSAKGTFRLSPHGERTVLFDLPRRDSDSKH